MDALELWNRYLAWFEQLHWWQIAALFALSAIAIFSLQKGITFMFDKMDEWGKRK